MRPAALALALALAAVSGCAALRALGPAPSLAAAVDTGCAAALRANEAALAYLRSPEGRAESRGEREAIVRAMAGARDACLSGREAVRAEGDPGARARALQEALLALAARVPGQEADPGLLSALRALLKATGELREEVRR